VDILVWHVHGAWTTAFVQGAHRYLIPTLPEHGPWGGGRPAAWAWPASAVEVPSEDLADTDVDLVVLQRPEEFELAQEWLGRTPGRDVPAVHLEHNAPREHAATSRHPAADRGDVLLVHVTHFNRLMWDAGSTCTTVVEHDVVDPGHRYTGELPAAAGRDARTFSRKPAAARRTSPTPAASSAGSGSSANGSPRRTLASPSTAWGPSVGGPHCSGPTGPKIVTDVVPKAAARWATPVSPLTTSAAPATSAQSCPRSVFPASTRDAARPAAPATAQARSRSSAVPVMTTGVSGQLRAVATSAKRRAGQRFDP
jgi:hypothetical protein